MCCLSERHSLSDDKHSLAGHCLGSLGSLIEANSKNRQKSQPDGLDGLAKRAIRVARPLPFSRPKLTV